MVYQDYVRVIDVMVIQQDYVRVIDVRVIQQDYVRVIQQDYGRVIDYPALYALSATLFFCDAV